ncbi:hypothetical protein ALQ11_200012 [Pseudomonas savastanoi pv. glycinea]|uniref:Uncharacterized protein n=1 Tax=Pseudomonas savastanoi pv. glycinea TaxID=318 RepID=A0AB74AZU1_PSESG|nr:hypothetical protein ALQ11_200012 [Pseudomonas savastanoi pv. glycinea]
MIATSSTNAMRSGSGTVSNWVASAWLTCSAVFPSPYSASMGTVTPIRSAWSRTSRVASSTCRGKSVAGPMLCPPRSMSSSARRSAKLRFMALSVK